MKRFTRRVNLRRARRELAQFLSASEPRAEFMRKLRPGEKQSEGVAVMPQILVVDDDPLYRARVRKMAALRHLPVTVCSSLEEVTVMSSGPAKFDIAIVDYYLDDLKAFLRGTDIALLLEPTPVILISNSEYEPETKAPRPSAVKAFVNKSKGINSIFDSALRAVGAVIA